MMVAVFAALLGAMLLGRLRWRLPAHACLALCFGLSAWLFLFEVYSPSFGFAIPWLQF
jgi:hypothetical protein